MYTFSLIFILINAIAFAGYHNEYMLSKLGQSLKHVTSLANFTRISYNTSGNIHRGIRQQEILSMHHALSNLTLPIIRPLKTV